MFLFLDEGGLSGLEVGVGFVHHVVELSLGDLRLLSAQLNREPSIYATLLHTIQR